MTEKELSDCRTCQFEPDWKSTSPMCPIKQGRCKCMNFISTVDVYISEESHCRLKEDFTGPSLTGPKIQNCPEYKHCSAR